MGILENIPTKTDNQLGVELSQKLNWDGNRIMKAFLAALEDSNFHGAYKWIEHSKDKLLSCRSLDTNPFLEDAEELSQFSVYELNMILRSLALTITELLFSDNPPSFTELEHADEVAMYKKLEQKVLNYINKWGEKDG